jgi:peptidoglycan hydrolase-like protein with peptidoglycan-binding domain
MNSGPVLSVGGSGSDVRRLQRLLVEMKLLDYQGIDGSFGPNTKASVESFQGSSGLVVDGIVGPATWGAMPPDPESLQLANGARGPVVAALQQGLTSYSTQNAAANPGPVDGIFGSHTDGAVRAYQGDRGVGIDGIVGDRTWWVPAGAMGATLASLSGVATA